MGEIEAGGDLLFRQILADLGFKRRASEHALARAKG